MVILEKFSDIWYELKKTISVCTINSILWKPYAEDRDNNSKSWKIKSLGPVQIFQCLYFNAIYWPTILIKMETYIEILNDLYVP